MPENAHWIEQLLEGEGLDRPERGRLKAETLRIPLATAPADVLRKLSVPGGEGWVCFTDRVDEVRPGEPLPAGIPLCAEIALPGRPVSLHLRQDPEGWALTTVERVYGDEADRPHWIFRRPFLHIDNRRALVYEVAWSPDETGTWRPWGSRFVGFAPEGGNAS